jgi:hypothetical protein
MHSGRGQSRGLVAERDDVVSFTDFDDPSCAEQRADPRR